MILTLLLVAAVIFVGGAGVGFWACGGIQRPGKTMGTVLRHSFASRDLVDRPVVKSLRVMTWNLAFAYGQGSEGIHYVSRSRKEYENRLDQMAEVILHQNVDLVLLQEVDFASGRSHFIDELAYLARAGGFEFSAPAVSWRANYVPYPFGRPKNHFGKISSGGGVLSRFPLFSNRVDLLPKPADFPWWYRAFYLFRYIQKVEVEINGENHFIINVHLDAFSAHNRKLQLDFLKTQIAEETDTEEKVLFIAGDFNTDGEDSTFRNLLAESPLQELALPNSATFPAHQPDIQFDHILVNRDFSMSAAQALPVGEISDHLPLVVEIFFKK